MTYNQALEKLQEYGQEHVLRYYDELSAESKKNLLEQIRDMDLSVLRSLDNKDAASQKGKITPAGIFSLDQIEQKKVHFTEVGLKAVREGKVGAVLLAGGMGTRLGSDKPKCMFDIGETKHVYIMQRLIENMMDVVRAADAYFPLYIMTSEKNHDDTVNFMEEMNYFGYDKTKVHFFKQDMVPAVDFDGKIYMEAKDRIATSPNGNGGWFTSMVRAGLLTDLVRDGVQWLNVFGVDNVLQRICDPCFVGAVLESGLPSGTKLIRKASPDEKVGVMCLEDGRPSVVEYYELTPEMMEQRDENGELAYNFGIVLNYLFRLSDLIDIMNDEFPIHVVNKKIPHIDADGNKVASEVPDGHKFELLILDMVHQLDSCLPYEVRREWEFAPIKNATGVDSVDSARAMCKAAGIEL